MNESIKNIVLSLGRGYTLTIIQLAGDVSTCEVTMRNSEGHLVRIGAGKNKYTYHSYVSADKLSKLINDACKLVEYEQLTDDLTSEYKQFMPDHKKRRII